MIYAKLLRSSPGEGNLSPGMPGSAAVIDRMRGPVTRPSNPFSTRFIKPGAVPFVSPAPFSPERLLDRIKVCRCGALVGPHGSGKSTLLQTLLPLLQHEFSSLSHYRLQAGQRWPRALFTSCCRRQSGALLIVDGFEQLPRWLRKIFLASWKRRDTCLLLTAHQPVPGAETLWQSAPDEPLARRLTQYLLRDCSEYHAPLMECFQRRWSERQPNLREAWFALYDDFERLLDRHAISAAPLASSRSLPHLPEIPPWPSACPSSSANPSEPPPSSRLEKPTR